MLGSEGCGKTSVINRIAVDKFDADCSHPPGVYFQSCEVLSEKNEKIGLNMWEITGMGIRSELSTMIYPNCDILLFVFDSTSKMSYEYMKAEFMRAKSYLPYTSPIKYIICSNKNDQEDRRVIAQCVSRSFALYNNALFLEVSCLSSSGFTQLINSLKTIVQNSQSLHLNYLIQACDLQHNILHCLSKMRGEDVHGDQSASLDTLRELTFYRTQLHSNPFESTVQQQSIQTLEQTRSKAVREYESISAHIVKYESSFLSIVQKIDESMMSVKSLKKKSGNDSDDEGDVEEPGGGSGM